MTRARLDRLAVRLLLAAWHARRRGRRVTLRLSVDEAYEVACLLHQGAQQPRAR